MGKKEILFISCVIALIFGAYFFVHRIMFPPPKSYVSFEKPKVDRMQQERDYIEKNNDLLNARSRMEQAKYERIFKNAKPILELQMQYNDAIAAKIAKLPPSKQRDRKEILKIIQAEREIYMYKKLPGQVHTLPRIKK